MNIHDQYKQEEKYNILAGYKKLIGKYIFCNAREDNITRVFIDNLNYLMNIQTNDGYWDVFTTIHGNPINKGLYICHIDDYRLDTNGYLHQFVTPIRQITKEELASGREVFKLLYSTDMFPEYYPLGHVETKRCNVEALMAVYAQEFEDYYKIHKDPTWKDNSVTRRYHFSRMIFEKILEGKLDFIFVNSYLQQLYPIEKLAQDIQEHLEFYYQTAYPTFYTEIKRKDIPLYDMSAILTFLDTAKINYDKLRREEKITEETDSPVRMVELVREYYVKLHAEQKAQKAAARKAKKAAKKEGATS